MPKLNKSNGIKKVDLEDITLKENIRFDYQEIKELAYSIERDGLIQPVVITKDNELIAGYRRFKAHQFLISEGKPFNQIEAIVKNGNFEILQLTENIQRAKLSPAELERALKKMLDDGFKQVEIAERLNKPKQWVSDVLKGGQVREKAESAGIDTEGISTSAMQNLRSVDEKDLPEVVEVVKKTGGTVKAAKAAVKKVDTDPFSKIKKEAIRLKKAGYDYQEIIGEIREVIL